MWRMGEYSYRLPLKRGQISPEDSAGEFISHFLMYFASFAKKEMASSGKSAEPRFMSDECMAVGSAWARYAM